MNPAFLHLSDEQLQFLSVLCALEKPVLLRVAGKLSPILPAPFMELMGRNGHPALIREIEGDLFCLSPDLTPEVRDRLLAMNDRQRLSDIIDRLIELDIIDEMDPDIVSRLLVKTGRVRDIAELEINQARKALKKGDQHRAMQHLWNVVKQLYEISEDPEYNRIFISATLKLSDLCFSLGTGFMELPRFLNKARDMASRLGDRRSHCLINLNRSIFLHIARQHEESSQALSEGLKEVEELGDEDILNRSAAFLGLNFFLKGMFREAEPHLERANLDFEIQGGESMTLGPLPMPFLLGWCVANLGHFQDAVGGLENSRRQARKRSQDALATTIRAILGAVLQMVGKYREAAFHLESARSEARAGRNTFALAITEGSLTFQSFMEGRIEEARMKMDRPAGVGGTDGFPRLYTAPHILEMVFEMETRGLPVNPRLNLENEIAWIRKAPNLHAKGAAYRLMAKNAFLNGAPHDEIRAHLENSKKFLDRSGDPVEICKTQLEAARLNLLEGKKRQAGRLAETAFETLSQHRLEFIFPEDLKPLLTKQNRAEKTRRDYRLFLSQCLKIFQYRPDSESPDRIMTRVLKFACRLLMAERGGIVYIDSRDTKVRPVLQAGYNMTESDIHREDFAPGMSAIHTAIRSGKAGVFSFQPDENAGGRPFIREAMCLPRQPGKNTSGAFYFDNIYLENRFNLLDRPLMERLADFMNDYIEQLVDYGRLKKETSIRSSAQSFRIEQMQREEPVFKSEIMKHLLAEAEQVANTDTTILIQGETGVGKEVLARHLHHTSPRKSGPFEVVDLTAIPESLLESELFGYEKGAFTGADQQKRGRIEMAHKGTLMLDEIGEIPLSFQVKLLRLLQEKTFVRVGGTRTLTSDFRLVAATNRELENEVAAGRFRQDLLYRLNMMPVVVPPLRKRSEDIIVLANYFLSQYAVKHNREGLEIQADDIGVLTRYPWPGNVRELKNVIERAVLLSRKGKLDFGQLDSGGMPQPAAGAINANSSHAATDGLFTETPSLEKLEKRYIEHILDRTGGKIGGPGGAGDLLGIKRTTLYSRMRKLGIRPNSRTNVIHGEQ